MPRRHLYPPQVAQIVTLVEEGYNYRQVGDRMDISSSVVSLAYNRYLEIGDYQRRVGQGRRRATNPRDDQAIVRRVRQEPFVPANVVARNFPNRRQQQQRRRQQQPRNISVQTVRNRLRETGVRSRSAARVPMLSPSSSPSGLRSSTCSLDREAMEQCFVF